MVRNNFCKKIPDFPIQDNFFPENVYHLQDPGSALWMTREEYITFGHQMMADNDNLLDEDG